MGRTFFKSCFISFLCLLTLSCSFAVKTTGDIEFALPNLGLSRSVSSGNPVKFRVSLKNQNDRYYYNEDHDPGDIVSIKRVPYGEYELSLFSETDTDIIEGSEFVSVRSGNGTTVNVQLKKRPRPVKPIEPENPDGEKPVDPENPDNVKPIDPNKPDNTNPDDPVVPEKKNELIFSFGNSPTIPEKLNIEIKIDGTTSYVMDVDSNKTCTFRDIAPGEYVVNVIGDSYEALNFKITVDDRKQQQFEVPLKMKPIYYVTGTGGNDKTGDGTVNNKLETVSRAVELILSKNDSSENFIIDVAGTVNDISQIAFEKNVNITIRGAKDGSSKIANSNWMFFVIGKRGDSSIKPNISFEDITIDGTDLDKAIYIEGGSVHLGDGAVINGKVGVWANSGINSRVYIGGSAKVNNGINLLGEAFITVEKPLESEVKVFVTDPINGSKPQYDTATHQIVKVAGGVKLADAVSKIKLGDAKYFVKADGMIGKIGDPVIPAPNTIADCYVGGNGASDNNDGSQNAPFATVSKAVSTYAWDYNKQEVNIKLLGDVKETQEINIGRGKFNLYSDSSVTITNESSSIFKIGGATLTLENVNLIGTSNTSTNMQEPSGVIKIGDNSNVVLGNNVTITNKGSSKEALTVGFKAILTMGGSVSIASDNYINIQDSGQIQINKKLNLNNPINIKLKGRQAAQVKDVLVKPAENITDVTMADAVGYFKLDEQGYKIDPITGKPVAM